MALTCLTCLKCGTERGNSCVKNPIYAAPAVKGLKTTNLRRTDCVLDPGPDHFQNLTDFSLAQDPKKSIRIVILSIIQIIPRM